VVSRRSAPDSYFVLVAVGDRGELAGAAAARRFGLAPVRLGLGRRRAAAAPSPSAPPTASTGAETAHPGTTGSSTARSVGDPPTSTRGQQWSDADNEYLRRLMAGNLAPSWKDVAEQIAGLSLVSRGPRAVQNRWRLLQPEQ
jgi:hypothetical protein